MKKQKLISVAIIIIGWTLPLVSWAGYLEYPCDEQESIPTREENCKACGSGRQYSNDMCIFANCSAGKFFGYTMETLESGCFDCSEPAMVVATSNACSRCTDANGTPTRTQSQSMESTKVNCSLKECPANTFRSDNGDCISCDSPKGGTTTRAQCDICPDREYDTTHSLCHLSTDSCRGREGYLTSTGNCVACTSTDEYVVLDGDYLCLWCSNGRYMYGDVCMAPCPEGTVPDYKSSPPQCRSCLVSDPLAAPAANCGKCPARTIDNDGYCVLKTCGSNEFLTKNGICEPCNILAPQDTDATLCTCTNREMVNDQCVLKTCPNGKFRDQNGTCFDCTISDVIADVGETECAKCTKRESYGAYCIPRCATGTYRYSVDECRSCDTVQEGTVTSKYALQVCTDCGFTPTQMSSNSSYICRKTCPAGQFNGGYGQCYACDTTETIPTSPEACAVCGDVREYQNGACLLKTCPDGMFRGRKAGTSHDACYACDDISQITSGECTQKCGNTRILGTNNICYSCQELNPFDVADQTACEQCQNRTYSMMGKCELSQCPDNHFRDYNGSCYACDDTRNDIRSSDCVEKCGDQRVLIGEYCAKACQPGEFRNGIDCVPCDKQIRGTETTQAECEQCGDRREMVDGQCLFKCPDGQFRDQYGYCYECTNTASFHETTATQCSRCNGIRTMKDETCILITCPDGYYRDDSSYACNICEGHWGIGAYTERDCQKCGLSWINDTCTKVICTDTQFVGTDGRCHECSDQTPWPANSSQCAKCGSKRISIDNGYGNACILCDGTVENAASLSLDEATCTKCCRGTATYTDDGLCICGMVEEEFNCPSGSFAGMDDVSSRSFQCFPCDISYDIWLPEAELILEAGLPPNHGEQECLACGNRMVVHSYCRLATCGTGEFWDATAGTCHKCTDTTSYPGVSQEACESCPNRTYVSGFGKSFCVFSGN